MLKIEKGWISGNIKKFYKKKVVIITGAGISVASGIPDFRSERGIFSDIKAKYNVNGPDLFSYRFGVNKETRPIYLEYIGRLKRLVNESKPNYTHLFFKYFVDKCKKIRVYSQNIDGLELKGGLSYSEDIKTNLVFLHGDLKYLKCVNCGEKEEFIETYRVEFENKREVKCKSCVLNKRNSVSPVLHTNIIHYNQDHPYSELISNCIQNDTGCNLLIVVGTRLDVFGVKNMVRYFKKSSKNIITVFINLEPPKKNLEKYFDFYFEGKSDDFFRALKYQLEEYKMYRRIKRLSICTEDGESKKGLFKENKKKGVNTLKRLSLTHEDIQSSFLSIKDSVYSPCLKKNKTKNKIETGKKD